MAFLQRSYHLHKHSNHFNLCSFKRSNALLASYSNCFESRHCRSQQTSVQESNFNKGPLEGIRILDLTRVLAGPFATMVLADLGASVIKVERPGVGDETRLWGPPFMGTESCYFFSVNRNKLSLAVDIKAPEGATILRELALRMVLLHIVYSLSKNG
ncbi:CoA-transferase family III [Trinorchestia longiramus]|nr:CoA-transferase family III [Trinorchestia longiramus]